MFANSLISTTFIQKGYKFKFNCQMYEQIPCVNFTDPLVTSNNPNTRMFSNLTLKVKDYQIKQHLTPFKHYVRDFSVCPKMSAPQN